MRSLRRKMKNNVMGNLVKVKSGQNPMWINMGNVTRIIYNEKSKRHTVYFIQKESEEQDRTTITDYFGELARYILQESRELAHPINL